MKLGFTVAVFLALTGLAACGTNPAATTVVCTDFRAGADMSEAHFGVGPAVERPYAALAQAVGDITVVANTMMRDVGASCERLAIELGSDPEDPSTVGKSDLDRVKAWCDLAGARIDAVHARLEAAHFVLRADAPRCAIDLGYVTDCQARCQLDPKCVEAKPEDRCPTGDVQGLCPGVCTGTCAGSETAPVACAGTCAGTCFGDCHRAGKDSDKNVETCTDGCTCAGDCVGVCTDGCATGPEGARCDAPCLGTCSVPLVGRACGGNLTPPRCPGDDDCVKSCEAAGAARAACSGGSLAVSIDDAARSDADLSRVVGALERNLPAIVFAARGRAQLLSDNANHLIDAAGHILAKSEDLGPKGASCGMLIGMTGSAADDNLRAALHGAKRVVHAVDGSPAPQ